MPNERRTIRLRYFTVVRGSLAISCRLKLFVTVDSQLQAAKATLRGCTDRSQITSMGCEAPRVQDQTTADRSLLSIRNLA
jgi:hypothetical protein